MVGSANQEIREVDARLASVKDKLSVLGVKVPLVDLVIVKLASKFKAVRSDHLGEIIQPLKTIVELVDGIDRNSQAEIVETEVGYTFGSGIDRRNAAGGGAKPWGEAQRP